MIDTNIDSTKLYVFLTILTVILCNGLGFSQGLNTIVIDPGHGGKDHGCSGDHSIEKHLTLDIAHKLKRVLNDTAPQLDVKLTRTHDVFIPLEERCAFANHAQADLFISIHCNQIDITSVNGTEVFVLGGNVDETVEYLLERERAYDHGGNSTRYGDHLNYILAQASHQQNLKESIQLASIITEHMEQHTDLKRRRIKQANFKVLKGLYMPSILIETGFLSHHRDEAYLLSNNGQYAVANAIQSGLSSYISHSVNYDQAMTPSTPKVMTRYHSDTYGIIIATTIGTSANTDRPEWNNVPEYTIYQEGNTFYHVTGRFDTFSLAEISLSALRQNGFKGAYIQSYNSMKTYAKLN